MTTPTTPASMGIPANEQKPLIGQLPVILSVIGLVLLAAGFIALTLWLASAFPAEIEALRDVFIILLALGSCLSGIVIVFLLIMIIRLVNMLEFEIKPILEKTNETLGTVRGTAQFVSSNVVQPSIKASSYVAGARRAWRVLFGNPRKNLPR